MPKLTPCPREDCTADVRHWHNPEPASSQVKTADNPAPIVLPTVGEVREAIIAGTKLGGWMPHTAAQAVLDLIASRVPVWQPVEPGTIRPGMRVRYVATGGIEGIFTVEDVADGRFYFKSGYAWSGMSDHAWFVDPRTVPAEPVDPRAELLAEELHKLGGCEEVWPCCSVSTVEHYRNDARDLLARLDAVRADA